MIALRVPSSSSKFRKVYSATSAMIARCLAVATDPGAVAVLLADMASVMLARAILAMADRVGPLKPRRGDISCVASPDVLDETRATFSRICAKVSAASGLRISVSGSGFSGPG